MTLLETYSLTCGLKSDSPYILEKYFPIPFKNYILIHAGSGTPAKTYDYFNEVIDLLVPILDKHNYKLIQIGSDKDPQLKGIADLRGLTDIHQSAYLLKNCKLLIGNDSCNLHIASSFNTPVIGLYGPTRPENHAPAFGHGLKRYIEADRQNGSLPSFSKEEYPKTINYIKPELICNNVLSVLNLKYKINRKSFYIGEKYNDLFFDVIMDSVVSIDFLPNHILNSRMDYLFNEQILAYNLSQRKFTITTNKPIRIDILKQLKQNIVMVFYEIDENHNVDFVKNITDLGIPFGLFSYLDEDYINKIKLSYFDYGIINKIKRKTLKDVENLPKSSTIQYKTNRFIISNGGLFLNKKDIDNKNPISGFNDNKSELNTNDIDFLENLENCYLFTD